MLPLVQKQREAKERKEIEIKEMVERKDTESAGIVDNMDIQLESALGQESYMVASDKVTEERVEVSQLSKDRMGGKEKAKDGKERMHGRAKAKAAENRH